MSSQARIAKSRYEELKRNLTERQRELQAEVSGKMRESREHGRETSGKRSAETLEQAAGAADGDLELALIQMKSGTLSKINDALTRLEQGRYGYCFECGDEIEEKRLRALPFAVRCKDCETQHEIAETRERSRR